MDVSEFGSLFARFLETVVESAPKVKSAHFPALVGRHFGVEIAALTVLREALSPNDHVDLSLALAEWLRDKPHEQHGWIEERYQRVTSFAALLADRDPVAPGPVEHAVRPISPDETRSCPERCLLLVTTDAGPLGVFICRENDYREKLTMEIIGVDRALAERTLREIRSEMRNHSVYRGKILSLTTNEMREIRVSFMRLPQIADSALILPARTRALVERHTIRFAQLGPALRDQKRHLKRGLLLYGPPGTGKTLTAMYLAGRMSDRTVILVTGFATGLIQAVCKMARALAPATVILEDVDLIAKDREQDTSCSKPLLFELLNEMDGLAEDADILFLLTTNSPHTLEPALAARPGRVDQAIEVPLPDAEGRLALLELYRAGLDWDAGPLDPWVAKTEGASGAFLRELLRKAALFATDAASPVKEAHLDEALRDLVVEGGSLTRSLLGIRSKS